MIRSFISSFRTAIAAGALMLSALPMAASAGVVYQSSPALTSTHGASAWCSTCAWGSYRVFDQFTLGQDSSITGFAVNLFSESSYWGHGLNFSIWSVGSGQTPGQQLFSQTLAASDFSSVYRANTTVTATTDDVKGLNLTAGTYYVSFYSASTLAVWGYNTTGGKLYQQGTGALNGQSAAFRLDGQARNVPEPATLALAGLALVGIGFVRRRKA